MYVIMMETMDREVGVKKSVFLRQVNLASSLRP